MSHKEANFRSQVLNNMSTDIENNTFDRYVWNIMWIQEKKKKGTNSSLELCKRLSTGEALHKPP